MARRIGELFFELRTSSEALGRDLKEGERQLTKFAEFVKANPLLAVTGLGAAFAGVAFQAAQAAAKIDLTFRQVTNTLGATAEEAAALREDLRAVSVESGKSREEIVGLFRAIAEGGPGGVENVRALAEAAIALSEVLGGDVGANAAGLDQITDIFAIDPARAKEVAAALFTIASGKVPLGDVLDALSKIGPEAAALGLSFEEVAAFLTRFLDQGFSVKRVSSLFKELAEQGAEGRKEIVRLAGAATDTAVAMGKLEQAQDAVKDSMEKQFEVLKNRLSDQWLQFGSTVLPPVTAALASLNSILDGSAAKLVGVGDGADRAMAGLLRVAEAQRKLAAVPAVVAPSAPTASPAAALGQRYADIVTATKNIEQLSLKALRENQQRLASLLSDPAVNDSLAIKGKALQDQIGAAIEAAYTKNRAKVEQANAELRKSLKDIADTIDQTFERIFADDDDRRKETIRDLDAESAARKRTADQLSDQVSALIQGKQAYEAVLVAQAKANAVEAERQRLAAVGLRLAPEKQREIEREIDATIRLENIKKALLAVSGGAAGGPSSALAQTTADVGALAEGLSVAASAAAGIASAFGEAGRQMAALIGQTSQLLTNLARAQQSGIFTDAQGKQQDVGFLGALSGKAGAAGTAAAVSSALGVVGAVVAIGDALDLFGTRAAAKAREMREAAVRFNRALDDFAIVSRTSLDEAIRANNAKINELVTGAAAKSGITFSGDVGSSRDLDAYIASLRAALPNIKEVQKVFGPFIAELERTSVVVKQNEAALRARNEAEIKVLSEDAAVRFLVARGLTEAAEAERLRLAQLREIAAAEQQFGKDSPYVAALRFVQEAETAAAAATRARAALLQQLTDDNTFLGGTSTEQLRRGFTTLGEAFAQFAGVFDEFDLSTTAGLAGAKAKIREIYESLAVDGISEAERPIVEFLRTLLGNIDGAISGLPETLDPIATALEAFAARVELFGTSLPQQLTELRTIFSGKFGDLFDEILTSADLGTDAGRDAFRAAIQRQLDAILADGVISESERAFYDVLVRFFDLANGAIAEADADAAAIVESAAANRQQRRTNASNRIELFDLTGADAFRESLTGFGAAFSDLFATFDLTNLEGITGAKGVLRGIFDELTALSDEEIFRRFGLTRDELVAALLDTDNGLDGLKGTLGDLTQASLEAARAAADFADQIELDFLRSQGRGQEADILAATAKRDERLKQAAQLGLGPDVLAQIEAIFQSDLEEIAKRYAPAVVEAVTGDSTVVDRGSSTSSTSTPARAARRTTSVVQDFGGLSEITAQSLAGLLREGVLHAAETARATAGMYAILSGGLPAPPSSLLRFAGNTTSAVGSSAGGVVISIGAIHIGSLNPLGMSPTDAANTTAREIARQLGKLVGQETRFLGSGVA